MVGKGTVKKHGRPITRSAIVIILWKYMSKAMGV